MHFGQPGQVLANIVGAGPYSHTVAAQFVGGVQVINPWIADAP